jgi:hypothetical protein
MRSAVSLLVYATLLAAPACDQPDEQAEEPEKRTGLLTNEPGALEGHTLFSPIQSSRILLLDMQGEVAHRWQTDFGFGGALHLLEDGRLIRGGRVEDNPRFHGGGLGGRIQEIDWEGNVLWDYVQADERRTLHHDSAVLQNGNVLMIAWEYRTPEEARAAGRDPEAVGEEGLWPDVVFEVRPTRPSGGEIVWEWNAWEHLIQDFDPNAPNYGAVAEHPERIDINADHRYRKFLSAAETERLREIEKQMAELGYADGNEPGEEVEEDQSFRRRRPDFMHTNTVTHHAELDLLVLSIPRLNEIWVIDHSTTAEEVRGSVGGRWGKGGDLLYRWGHPQNYGHGEAADQQLFFQHQPTWLAGEEPGELRVLLFNNGLNRSEHYSTVDELVLPFDPERGFLREPGQPFGPAAPIWTYRIDEDDYAPFVSGAQRLSNGNTLICAGITGRILEVDADGELVWDYRNPFGGDTPLSEAASPGARIPRRALFRATRIPIGDPRLAGRF